MKTRGLFLSALLMGAVMAGCSNEEVMNEEFQKPDGNEYYMAVNFFTSESGSRAEGDFAAASDAETDVNNAVFYFLDENGNSCADPYKHGELTLAASTHHAGDDRQATPIIVMKNPTTNPSSIVVLLNVANDFAYENYKSLSQLQAIAGDYVDNANGFVMSNSVYANADDDVVIGAPVTAANIYKTRKELEVGVTNNSAVAVPVHVERVLAKVQVTNKVGTNVTNNEITLTDKNGTETVAVNVTINGWWLDNTKDESLIIKDLDPSEFTAQQTWWNDAANLRSYWAESYANADFLHNKWNSNDDDAIYCHENTSKYPTQLVVAATLSVGNDDATTLVRWRNTYYTEEGFKVAFLNNFLSAHKYYYETTAEGATDKTYETITVDMLDFAFNTNDNEDVTTYDYEAIVTLNENAPALYTVNGSTATAVEASEVSGKLEGFATVKLWKNGQAYYYLPIEHLDASNANAIVRNHVYQMNLTSVAGLGTPVPNAEKVIIPTKVENDELSYIAASVYVLKWKVVENDVELN